MATQLRAVQYATIAEAIDGLAFARSQFATVLPEAESITFSFTDDYRLILTIKTNKREDRDNILFRLRNDMIPNYKFENIIEGVETGARRRLTVTAEVR